MRIIPIDDDEFNKKINFVDSENKFVGFDLSERCCENFGWFISQREEDEPIDGNGIIDGLEDYIFNQYYFGRVENSDDLEEGALVRFKLEAEGKPDLFLHLFNHHNGYYSHGFLFCRDEYKIREGVV